MPGHARTTMRLLAVVAVLCAVHAARGEQASPSRKPALDQQIKRDLALSDGSRQTLSLREEASGTLTAGVLLGDSPCTLELQPHSLRAADFRLILVDDDGSVEVTPQPPETYRGFVRGADGEPIPGSRVAASRRGGTLTAMVDLNDGSGWLVQPASEGPGPYRSTDHIVYSGKDIVAPDSTCGVVDLASPGQQEHQRGGDPGGSPRGTGFSVCDIAFDADYPFYQLNNSSFDDTLHDIENVMNGVEFVYERDTSISYEITTIIIRTTSGADPYTSTNDVTLLNQFQSHWNSFNDEIRRDVAHLMTGRDLDGIIVGRANIAKICIPSQAYALTQNRFTTNYNLRVGLTAHEIGHNWSACHCDQSGCISSPCRIMCSDNNGCDGPGLPNFGWGAISDIVNHKDSRICLSSLADPRSLPFIDTFPNSTISTSNWSYFDGAITTTAGLNEPTQSRSLNLDFATASFSRNNDIRSNFILMAGEVPSTQLTYWTEHIGVESGEELIVEYWNDDTTWVELNRITSDGVDQSNFVQHVHTLPSDAFHDEFRIRFRVNVDNSSDDWYIDDVKILSGDGSPPFPSPMTFSAPPAPDSTSAVSMSATVAFDTDSPPVEYQFVFSGGGAGGTTGPWQASENYTDTGLTANSSYRYRVKARDSAPVPNETMLSDEASTSTLIETPTGVSFANITDTSMDATADGTFTFLFAGSSGLFFEMTPDVPGNGANAWFQPAFGEPPTLALTGLIPGTEYTFRVKARNRDGAETPFTASFAASTTGGCTLLGDVDGSGAVDGDDIAGYVRAKLGVPEAGDNPTCADYGTGDLAQDTLLFVGDLLGEQG